MHKWVYEQRNPSYEFDQGRRGAWKEFIGDFHIIAGKEERAAQAYDQAYSIYEVASDFNLGMAEWEHHALIGFYEDIRRAIGKDMEDWYEQKSVITIPEWIDYKRERMPGLLDELETQGEWSSVT
jgi:hypothetical protein